MSSNLFRKSALDKLSSPERLDQLLTITPFSAWLALSAIGGILVVTLLWSIFGSLPNRVSGPGICIREGGAFQVVSRGDGSVLSINIKVGEVVEKGEIIAHLDLPDLALKVENTRSRLEELQAEDKTGLAAEKSNLALTLTALEEQRTTLQKSAADFDEQVTALEEQTTIQTGLQKRGLIPRSTLLSTQTALATARQSASNSRVEMANNEARRSETTNSLREKAESRRMRIADNTRELREVERQLEEAVNVRSPFNGRAVEVQSDIGGIVNRGESVVALENISEAMQVLLFIPAGDGKRVKVGMAAQIAPSVAKREEYGFMKGTVVEVSSLPATEAAAESILHNKRLVNQLFQQGNPMIVTIELTPDKNTESGYAWSTSLGPPTAITSGTLVEGQIVVQRQRPITLVLPYLRKLFGVL